MDNLKPIKSADIRKHCNDFLILKRATGLKYRSEERHLQHFARFCEERYPNAVIPEDVLAIWLSSDSNQSLKTKNNKVSLIKSFAQYMFSLGYTPLKIPLIRYTRNTKFIPHIFTEEEMTAIWTTVDNIQPLKRLPNVTRCLPALFRLLYSCGLRISEALALEVGDVDFSSKTITVRHTKLERERLIPMSDSLTEVLKQYANECTADLPKNAPFFYYHKGVRLTQHTIYGRFRKILKDSGIPYKGKDRGPRLHDLRHTFSVNAMNKLVDEGKDIYAALPILSAFLGHSSVESTERYVRLTEDRLSGITECVSLTMPTLFPEVKANGEI